MARRAGVALWLVLAACVMNAQAPSARYRELKRVIDRNTGFAHMTRGMNAYTLYALRGCVTAKDLPVLDAMLGDKDRVTRMTVANVLVDLGAQGRSVVEAHLARPVSVDDKLMFQETLEYASEPGHRAILDYPMTPEERSRIRGCAAGRP